MKTREIARVCTGTRLVMGTEWPIESYLTRQEYFGKVRWIITWNLCNGTPSGTEECATKKGALEKLLT